MTTMTLQKQSMSSMFLAVSMVPSSSASGVVLSACDFAGVGVYTSAAAQALAIAIGADAPAHALSGWVLPCTPIVDAKRTNPVSVVSPILIKETTRRTATKPASKRVNTWHKRPSGIRETPPG